MQKIHNWIFRIVLSLSLSLSVWRHNITSLNKIGAYDQICFFSYHCMRLQPGGRTLRISSRKPLQWQVLQKGSFKDISRPVWQERTQVPKTIFYSWIEFSKCHFNFQAASPVGHSVLKPLYIRLISELLNLKLAYQIKVKDIQGTKKF